MGFSSIHKKFILFLLLSTPLLGVERVGLFTATMDPPHLVHKQLVTEFIEKFKLDYVYVIVNVRASHKPHATKYTIRKKLTKLTFADLPQVNLLDKEAEDIIRSGRLNDFIFHLLNQGKRVLHLVGSDSFLNGRDKYITGEYSEYYVVIAPRSEEDLKLIKETKFRHKTLLLSEEIKEYSSTKARNEILAGETPSLIHPDAFKLIQKKGYYIKSKKEKKHKKKSKKQCKNTFLK